jgi:hypothetical protein
MQSILVAGRSNATSRESVMSQRTIAANFALCVIFLASASPGYAEDAPQLHPGPWPIWHWHNHHSAPT